MEAGIAVSTHPSKIATLKNFLIEDLVLYTFLSHHNKQVSRMRIVTESQCWTATTIRTWSPTGSGPTGRIHGLHLAHNLIVARYNVIELLDQYLMVR